MVGLSTFCGGPFQTNGYLLRCGDKSVLFDAPLGVTGALKSGDVRPDLLVLTHQHHDHIMDAGLAATEFDCPIYAFSEFDEDLTLKASLDAATGRVWDIPSFTIAKTLSEGETLEIGNRTFSILHVPGHSPDSICLHDADAKILIGGDVLFQGGIGRTDFPNGSFDTLLSGIKEKLWLLPDETTVYPGHGPETTIGFEKRNNPFVR